MDYRDLEPGEDKRKRSLIEGEMVLRSTLTVSGLKMTEVVFITECINLQVSILHEGHTTPTHRVTTADRDHQKVRETKREES